MTRSEIARVQEYLRITFANPRIVVKPPKKQGQPVEVYCADEFIGVLHRDEDEGEVSYDLHMSILDLDLPPDPSDARGL
ncbi:hypothetical protein C882_1878 [Caenispirillum salinarum AK4]|uniref:DUF3126 domain-containing protein n=1 Tax=Caenispirillum salinarum AK4 TaxID=1238182 RepID=K9HFB4_9PROT|nr:DUF3126 family protein [Caenispirillum salinarum]EKV27376.1 hypothetical protein C882_1878 [Caenispirillum salinarum AK4]